MARNRARTNADWKTPENLQWEHVTVEVLMDIRDELKKLNAVMHCPNVQAMARASQRTATIVGRLDKRLAKKIPLK